ncbi:MAG: hypothetical protein NDI82_03040 [Anaeromyxobacteraceae bacterium]|nr:hypothetical protein [Anaeromyxobacteraceae bacterium]
MDLKTGMIAVTFAMGVVLVLVAVVALLRKIGSGEGGSLEFLGVKLSGGSAPVLFLGVGAVLLLSGFGWASSRAEVAQKAGEVVQKTAEAQRAGEQAREAELARKKALKDLGELQVEYQKEAMLLRALAAKAPAAVRDLPTEQRARIERPVPSVPNP